MSEQGKAVVHADKVKAPIAIGSRGLVITTLDEAWRFAQYVCASNLAPKGLEKPEAIVVAIQFGLELGLTPFQALQSVAVINGKPTLYGDSLLGLCMGTGVFDFAQFREWMEGAEETNLTAYCQAARKGMTEPVVRSFSMADAKRAGLLGKEPWQKYPRRMLQMRARAFCLRDVFPDILRGVHAYEEFVGAESDWSASVATRPITVIAERLNELQKKEVTDGQCESEGQAR